MNDVSDMRHYVTTIKVVMVTPLIQIKDATEGPGQNGGHITSRSLGIHEIE
jgi:hypothetical protein